MNNGIKYLNNLMENKCQKDYIMRKGYTRKNGIVVLKKCIKSTRFNKSKKRSDEDAEILAFKKQLTKKAYSLAGGPKKCPNGTILRKAYMRKNTKKAYPSRCVKTNKSPEQIKVLSRRKPILLRSGTLGKYGYHNLKGKTVAERRNGLKKAIKAMGSLVVMRKINILMVFSRNNPKLHSIYKNDKKWIYKNYEVKAQ
tara:strand:+ start:623 stop:1213 length:591 start_codon:yes stop_codon:yes gene_type:complete